MITFYIKKFVAVLFFPVPLFTVFLIIGLLFLWFGRNQKAGRMFVTIGTALALLFSTSVVPDFVLGTIEQQYKPLVEKKEGIRWIVVLGSESSCDRELPTESQLGPSSLYRTMEGIRLRKEYPDAKILLTGNSASASARVAVASGIPEGDLVVDETPLDTADEARLARELVQHNGFILVTSAAHMPRAIYLFQKQGLLPVPAPVEYTVERKDCSEKILPGNGVKAIRKSSIAVYELLGNLWVRIAR